MKTNANDPINMHPTLGDVNGLTKREYFAAMALQGIWANPHDVPGKIEGQFTGDAIAIVAVKQADALITALNNNEEGK